MEGETSRSIRSSGKRLVKEVTIRREPCTKLMRALAASSRLLGEVETSTLLTTCRVFSGEPQVGKSRYIERFFTYSQAITSQEDADGN